MRMAENRPFALSDIDKTRRFCAPIAFCAILRGRGAAYAAVERLFQRSIPNGCVPLFVCPFDRRAVAGHVIKKPRKRPINKHGARRDELVYTA